MARGQNSSFPKHRLTDPYRVTVMCANIMDGAADCRQSHCDVHCGDASDVVSTESGTHLDGVFTGRQETNRREAVRPASVASETHLSHSVCIHTSSVSKALTQLHLT
jgi:hypothetical protein